MFCAFKLLKKLGYTAILNKTKNAPRVARRGTKQSRFFWEWEMHRVFLQIWDAPKNYKNFKSIF